MKKFIQHLIVITGMLSFPHSSLADIDKDQMAVVDLTMCYNNVYTKAPYNSYVYERDLHTLENIDERLRKHLKKSYSKNDANHLMLVGMVEGDSKKPKPNIPAIDIVKGCRALVNMIGENYP